MLTHAEIAELRSAAEAELMKYPGVVGVDYGVKEEGGQTTDRLSLRVYVIEKKDKGALRPDEVIPPHFRGIPTDVVTVPRYVNDHCEDFENHSPLVGGISIGTLLPLSKLGTLGFFATINGTASPNNVAFVSNHHVLMSGGAHRGDTVFQPQLHRDGADLSPVVDVNGTPVNQNPVGSIGIEGAHSNHPYTYPGEAEVNFWVDASAATINVCLSSWCKTNCGTDFNHDIHILNVGGRNDITGVARARPNEDVFKVGRRTGRTKGRVISPAAPAGDPADPAAPKNIIIIEALEIDAACDGPLRFTDEGDSGAALVNSNRELIGVVFGHDPAHIERSFACHIDPVLDVLRVQPITAARTHEAEDTLEDAPGVVVAGRVNHTPMLHHRLRSTERGRELAAIVEAQRQEVVHLVNHRRAVTVAWHRSKGPAFLAHAVEGVRDPSHVVPREIEGVTRQALLENMARVLNEYGSPALREAIARHAAEALAHAERLDNPHEILERLEGREGT
jgi:hypothetical protein